MFEAAKRRNGRFTPGRYMPSAARILIIQRGFDPLRFDSGRFFDSTAPPVHDGQAGAAL